MGGEVETRVGRVMRSGIKKVNFVRFDVLMTDLRILDQAYQPTHSSPLRRRARNTAVVPTSRTLLVSCSRWCG